MAGGGGCRDGGVWGLQAGDGGVRGLGRSMASVGRLVGGPFEPCVHVRWSPGKCSLVLGRSSTTL